MPALSQNLTFTVGTSTTVVLDYPNTGTGALSYSSNPIKGDGYFGSTDGLHTVQTSISEFVGIIAMQGTLAAEPTDTDWFPINLGINVSSIDTTGAIVQSTVATAEYTQAATAITTYNFTGNFVWIRANVSEWTEGTVNSIRINH